MFNVPFSSEAFFRVFAAYNQAIWPVQLLLTVAAVAAIGLTFRRAARADRWVAGFLALLWVWAGVVYHIVHFATINPAAYAFGTLFVLQGLLFIWWGVVLRGRLCFAPAATPKAFVAGLILLYALAIYPLLGMLAGHAYLASPTFGAPCPTVIYTFGVLLLAHSVPVWLLVIPAVWAVLGSSAVFAFGVLPDAGLLVSAVVAFAFLLRRRRSRVAGARLADA